MFWGGKKANKRHILKWAEIKHSIGLPGFEHAHLLWWYHWFSASPGFSKVCEIALHGKLTDKLAETGTRAEKQGRSLLRGRPQQGVLWKQPLNWLKVTNRAPWGPGGTRAMPIQKRFKISERQKLNYLKDWNKWRGKISQTRVNVLSERLLSNGSPASWSYTADK